MSEALNELGAYIELKQSDNVIGYSIAHGELTVDVVARGLPALVEFLTADAQCRFSTLVDITAVDYPSRDKRYDVVYHFLSMYQNHRIRLRALVRENEAVPSIVGVNP